MEKIKRLDNGNYAFSGCEYELKVAEKSVKIICDICDFSGFSGECVGNDAGFICGEYAKNGNFVYFKKIGEIEK